MIVLDTNVISEVMRPRPDPMALAWIDRQLRRNMYVTTITLAEIRFGIELLPTGRRRTDLALRFEEMLVARFSSRVLTFDESASLSYAIVAAQRQRLGRRSAVPDMQIAAICRSNGASLATRNTKDFEHTGVPLIDPWEVPAQETPHK